MYLGFNTDPVVTKQHVLTDPPDSKSNYQTGLPVSLVPIIPNLSSLLQFTSEQATPRRYQMIVKSRAVITGVGFFCPRATVSPVVVIFLPPRNAHKGCVPVEGGI